MLINDAVQCTNDKNLTYKINSRFVRVLPAAVEELNDTKY